MFFPLKEHIALDRMSWSLKSFWNHLLWNAYVLEDILIVEYIDPHKYNSNCTFFLLCRKLTRSAILWNQNFDSTKWSTMFLRDN